jgi:hypothetical protein
MKNYFRTRRAVLAGGAALVIGGVAAASVAAQQQAAPADFKGDALFVAGDAVAGVDGLDKMTQRRQDWLKAIAAKLGVTPEKLDQAIQDVAKEQGNLPPPMLLPLPALDAGAPGTFSIRIDPGFAAAAKAIGISEDQLKQESANKSLTDVARAHNVDPKVVADAIKAQRRADLDEAAADGKLPAAMADRLKSHLDQEVQRLMDLPGLPGGRSLVFVERSVSTGSP